MNNTTFFNITPIDGRYKNLTVSLKALFTEYAFIKQRVIIEIKYFLFLLKLNNIIEKKFQKNVKDINEKTKESILKITYKKDEKKFK